MPASETHSDEANVRDGLFYRLFDEAERVRWRMTDVPWDDVATTDASAGWIAFAREMLVGELTTFSATERFFVDFADDVDFTQWLSIWLYEETKHPSAFVTWLDRFGERFDSRFMLQGRQTLPFMPSRMGTLCTNIISEMVAAALYTAVGRRPDIEPVLGRICMSVGGDEARHAASFYCFAKKRLARSEDPTEEIADALKVLHFWITPELNARVSHPVNLLVQRYRTHPTIGEAVPIEVIEAAVDNAYKRACRVFETLLGLELRSRRDVAEQLAGLEVPPG
jgi:hypothetical protein